MSRLAPVLLACLAAHAQTAPSSFEVASVKPATPLGPMGKRVNRKGGPGTDDPGTYTCLNCPVSWVLDEAFDLQPYEYGGPDWVQDTRFDFMAKIPPGTSKEAFRLMLQNLPAERFHLLTHRDHKEVSGYRLTVGKSGAKFHETVPHDETGSDNAAGQLKRDADGFPILSGGTTMAVVPGHARIRSAGQTMPWLARMLAGQFLCPVMDAIGLTAKYDYILSWAYEEGNRGAGPLAGQDVYHPALLRALESQLGLRLEKANVPVAILIVDRMDKTPTGN